MTGEGSTNENNLWSSKETVPVTRLPLDVVAGESLKEAMDRKEVPDEGSRRGRASP